METKEKYEDESGKKGEEEVGKRLYEKERFSLSYEERGEVSLPSLFHSTLGASFVSCDFPTFSPRLFLSISVTFFSFC